MRHPDPDTLRQHARDLRRDALSGIACGAAVKWRSLMESLRERRPALPRIHAAYPCQSPAAPHP
jgi:hypothetical protein